MTDTFRSTTIVAVRRNGRGAMAGDGQVSLGQTVVKSHARKVRRIAEGKILAGFAGARSCSGLRERPARGLGLVSTVRGFN